MFAQCLRRRYQTGPRKSEKWEVAACCLAVMREILKQYDVNSSDFVRDFLGSADAMNNDTTSIAYQQKSVGFMLMRSLLNPNSVVLETLLAIVTSHTVEDLERAESSLAGVKSSILNSSKHHDRGIPENDEMLELFYAGKWLEARFERRDASNAYLHVLDMGGNVSVRSVCVCVCVVFQRITRLLISLDWYSCSIDIFEHQSQPHFEHT